jgi:hypothetical protein
MIIKDQILSKRHYSIDRQASLTASGKTTDMIDTQLFSCHTIQMVVSNINTNVVLRAEGSLDGTNWFNLDDLDSDLTITSNGTYMMYKPTFVCLYIRINFVSESGGTSAVIDVTYMGE